ncbi:MAG: hypothetical protein AAF004_11145 [Pseudomonadota bacterium]
MTLKLPISLITLGAVAFLTLGCADKGHAAPDGFQPVADTDDAIETYRSAAGEEVRIASLEALQALNQTDPALRSDNARDRLDSAIYIMNLGMPETTDTIDDNPRYPMVQGSAYTEDGDDVTFVATWQGRPGEEILVMVLMPIDDFDRARAQKLARGTWGANSITKERPATVASKDKDTRNKARTGARYPAPQRTSKDNPRWEGWHYVSDTEYVARKDDSAAPRAQRFANISPTEKGPRAALELAVRKLGIKKSRFSKIVETQIARQLVGSPNFVALGTSTRNGKSSVVFAQIFQGKGADAFSVLLIEVYKQTYVEWGGIAAALSATGVIAKPTDIPEQYRTELASAPFDQQLVFYHVAYTQVMNSLFQGIFAANMSTFTMMQNINYDLVFDGRISLETITGLK